MAEAKTMIFISEVQNDFLTCPICMDVYEDPRILSCGHKLCLNCIKGLIEAEVNTFFLCPQDREEIEIPMRGEEGFVKDFTLNGLIEKFNTKEEEKQKENKKKLCSAHVSEELIFYCKTCSMNICPKCVPINHQKHWILSIEDGWAQEIQPLISGVSDIRGQLLPQLERHKALLHKSSRNQKDQYLAHVKKVETTAAMMKRMIEEQSTRQISELKHIYNAANSSSEIVLAGIQGKEHTINDLIADIEDLQTSENWVEGPKLIHEYKNKLQTLSLPSSRKEFIVSPGKEYNVSLHEENDASLYRKFTNTFGEIFKVNQQITTQQQVLQRESLQSEGRLLAAIPTGLGPVTDVVLTPSGKIAATDGKMLKIYDASPDSQDGIVLKTREVIYAQLLNAHEGKIIAASQFCLSFISEEGKVIRTINLKSKNRAESVIACCMAVDKLGGIYIGLRPMDIFISKCSSKIYKILYKDPLHSMFQEWKTGYGSLKSMCCTQTNNLITSVYHDSKLSVQMWNKLDCCWEFIVKPYTENLACPIECDGQGHIYIVDNANIRVIKLTPSGCLLSDIISRADGFDCATSISISGSRIILGHENGNLTLLSQ